MKPFASELFQKLESPGEEGQRNAALSLALLLEIALNPQQPNPTARLLLSEELLNASFSNEETEELLGEIGERPFVNGICRDARFTLITALGKVFNVRTLSIILRFLEVNAKSLSEAEAYTIVASIRPTLLPVSAQREIGDLFKRYRTEEVLSQFGKYGSERLNQQIGMALRGLPKR